MSEPVPVSPAAQAVETPETDAHFARQRERHIASRIDTARRSGRMRGDQLLRRPDFVWDAVTEGLESQRRMAQEAVNARRVDLARAEGELARLDERLRARARDVDPRLNPAEVERDPAANPAHEQFCDGTCRNPAEHGTCPKDWHSRRGGAG